MTDEAGKELSHAQQMVIIALLDERTIAGAARKSGVARSTIYNWLERPEFASEVGRVRGLLFTEALDLINAGMAKAIAKLLEALDHHNAMIRLRAASEVARLGMEMRQGAEVEAKLRELEERARTLTGRRDG